MSGARVVAAARCWLGTPYRHQASRRGAGCDCLGLVRGVWRALYGCEPQAIPPYSPDWGEPQGREVLWEAARRHLRMRRADEPGAAGDLLLFRMRARGVAKHLGIAAEGAAGPTFIHAMSGRGVVESALSAPWARRVVARFVFPDTDTDTRG
ncbi:peptidase [Rhodovulum sp. 12E13]|uniref:NlpC/P60 family protein n=1 Tax=Rhodovulum sp. 12E13 TaxID=2203891 RepID=UPI000E1AFF32|nr:NlpC/P60 family protein [Rhodovulum sp. 12E13]RDC74451.1 peptidase [Rhodovulum sp. 12E13]